MNKNKKRLSRLLIPMLASTAINVNAMEEEPDFSPDHNSDFIKSIKDFAGHKKKERSKSTGRYHSKTTPFKEHDKFFEQRTRVVEENPSLVQQGRQGVLQYKGPALDKLKSKGYCLVGSIPKTTKNYDLRSSRTDAAGHAGSVAKYKKGNQYYAVKFEPNPKKTGLETFNNNTYHNGDNKNEDQFYEDAETLFINCPWVTRCYAKFEDEYGTYTVTDWVSGKTITKWAEELKKKRLSTQLNEIAAKGKQILTIVNNFYKNNKMNTDLHGGNLMVTETGTVVVVDHGKYRDMNNIKGEPSAIATKTFMFAMYPLLNALDLKDLYKYYDEQYKKYTEYGYLYDEHKHDSEGNRKAYLFYTLRSALKSLNCDITADGQLIIGECKSFYYCQTLTLELKRMADVASKSCKSTISQQPESFTEPCDDSYENLLNGWNDQNASDSENE